LVFSQPVDELLPSIDGPFSGASKVVPVLLWQMLPEFKHALDDASGVAHQRIAARARRGIEWNDDVALNVGDGLGKLEMLWEFGRATRLGRSGSVGVGWGNGQGATEEDGCAAVVDENDGPETHAELAFILGEDRYGRLWRLWVLLGLSGRVVVETKFDGEPNEAAD
jgi:hypothetical protein